jgi:hypothetical protein
MVRHLFMLRRDILSVEELNRRSARGRPPLQELGEQKNAKICLPLGITIKSDFFSHGQDPSPTLAVHCAMVLMRGLSPYQSTRLSRYNAVS